MPEPVAAGPPRLLQLSVLHSEQVQPDCINELYKTDFVCEHDVPQAPVDTSWPSIEYVYVMHVVAEDGQTVVVAVTPDPWVPMLVSIPSIESTV